MATVSEGFVCSLELRVSAQLGEWCYKEILTCITPGTPQQSDGCSASRALTLPSQLRVSVSQYINSAVQRAQAAVIAIRKAWYKHLSKNSKAIFCEKPGSWAFLQTFCFCSALVTQILSYFHFREWLALTLLHLSFVFLWFVYSEKVFCEIRCHLNVQSCRTWLTQILTLNFWHQI